MEKFALPKKNIVFIIAGLILILIGYLLMTGGGAESRELFNYDLFSVRRLYIAPLFILAGFVVEIVAIMKVKRSGEKGE